MEIIQAQREGTQLGRTGDAKEFPQVIRQLIFQINQFVDQGLKIDNSGYRKVGQLKTGENNKKGLVSNRQKAEAARVL